MKQINANQAQTKSPRRAPHHGELDVMDASIMRWQEQANPKEDFETSPSRSFGEVSKMLVQAFDLESTTFFECGTEIALKNLSLGGAADFGDDQAGARSARRESASQTAKRPSGKAGTRNRADRESQELKAAQIANLKAATHHALKIGLPFTRMITIHWQAAGVPLDEMAKVTGRFIDLMTKTLARHGSPTAWVWVHENGYKKGGHCHLLIHVPAELVNRVARLQRKWLRKITGNPYKKRVICGRPIGGRLGLEHSNPALLNTNLATVLGYVVKQAGPEAASQHSLDRLEEGGRIIGKRCGTSQNIGAKARKKEEC